MDDHFNIHVKEATKIQPIQPVVASQLKTNDDENYSKKTANSGDRDRVQPVEETSEIVDKMNDFLQSFSTKLQFKFDPESSATKILVMENGTDRVIRQIPPEEMVQLSEKMDEISGIIFNSEA